MKGGWHYIEFPYNSKDEFGKSGYVRVQVTVNDVPLDCSLLPMRNGRSFFAVPLKIRKATGLTLGRSAHVTVKLDERPIEIHVPEELTAVFDIDPDVKELFHKQTKSVQREICKWINEGKREQTRADRAAEIMRRFTTPGETFGGRPIKK